MPIFLFLISVVEIWKKRKIIKNKQLAKHPSILNYIAGTKYERPFVKVFMRQKDLDGEQFIRQHSTLSVDTYYDFVNVSAKSTNRKEMEKMKDNKKEAPVLPDDIRNIMNKIINSQAEKIYANHTTVSGLGVSNVKHEEDNFIEGPCIVVYCLDKDLIPYGKTLLPTSVKGCPCDTWSNIKQNNVIGEVKESFIGNFDGEDEFQDKFGIDAAFVQSYQKRLGGKSYIVLNEKKTEWLILTLSKYI